MVPFSHRIQTTHVTEISKESQHSPLLKLNRLLAPQPEPALNAIRASSGGPKRLSARVRARARAPLRAGAHVRPGLGQRDGRAPQATT